MGFLCESRVLTQLFSIFLASIWVNWTIMNLVFSLKIFKFNKTSSRDHEGMRFSCLCCLVYVTQAHLQMDGTILSGLDLCTKQSINKIFTQLPYDQFNGCIFSIEISSNLMTQASVKLTNSSSMSRMCAICAH